VITFNLPKQNSTFIIDIVDHAAFWYGRLWILCIVRCIIPDLNPKNVLSILIPILLTFNNVYENSSLLYCGYTKTIFVLSNLLKYVFFPINIFCLLRQLFSRSNLYAYKLYLSTPENYS
jgi:hypothetical protein